MSHLVEIRGPTGPSYRGLSLARGHLCNAVGDVPYAKRPRRSRPSPCPVFPYIKGPGSFIRSHLCDAAVGRYLSASGGCHRSRTPCEPYSVSSYIGG